MMRVNPDQLIQAAHQFKQAGAETQAMLGGMSSAVNGLMLEWEGLSAQQFYEEYSQWERTVQGMVGALEAIGQRLAQYSEMARESDHLY